MSVKIYFLCFQNKLLLNSFVNRAIIFSEISNLNAGFFVINIKVSPVGVLPVQVGGKPNEVGGAEYLDKSFRTVRGVFITHLGNYFIGSAHAAII